MQMLGKVLICSKLLSSYDFFFKVEFLQTDKYLLIAFLSVVWLY